jgi:hypothetical protein
VPHHRPGSGDPVLTPADGRKPSIDNVRVRQRHLIGAIAILPCNV